MGKTRMEELFNELYTSSKQHDPWQRYEMIRELRELMKRPKASGSDRFERALDDEELIETEVATELIGIEDETVKRETNTEVISAIVKKDQIPQIQIPDSQKIDAETELPQHPVGGTIISHLSPLVPRVQFQEDLIRMVDEVMGFATDDCFRGIQLFDPGGFNCIKDSGVLLFGSHQLEAQGRGVLADSLIFGVARESQPEVLHHIRTLLLPYTFSGVAQTRVESPNTNRVWKPGGPYCETDFGVEFYELEYRKLHINHCFAVQEFSGIHGSISGPWHLAFDPGGIITCTACDDFVVTHTQWVGHAKFEGCRNVQTLATNVDVEEKQAWIENAWFKIQVFSDFDIASWIGLEIYSWKYKKQINIGHNCLNGMCNKLVYDEEKKKLRHVGDDVKKGKNSFLRDVKIILALAVKEYRMGKAAERLLPGHYRLFHTFDQRGSLNATVIAGTIMQSSLKLYHQLRVACLHHTSLGFLYGSLPRPPEENHSNFSNMLQYHETWSCSSLRTNRVWDPGG